MSSIAVVGGGIIGLVSAFLLQQRLPQTNITLVAEKLSPFTTSDVAAGAWGPFPLADTPVDDLMCWAETSYQMVQKLPNAYNRGISPLNMTCLSDEIYPWLSQWKPILRGYSELDEKSLQALSNAYGKEYKIGFNFSTYTCEASKLLPYLLQEFLEKGGYLQQYRVTSLSELAGRYDVIMNCPGLEAKHIVPDDNMKPGRGQLVRVQAPWIKHSILDYSESGYFIIPNQDSVVLGGTNTDSWETSVNPNDTQTIVDACIKMMPSLHQATSLREVVGLRPNRYTVRLERETRQTEAGAVYEVVHNYGHGGAGITLSWGTATEAITLVEQILRERTAATNQGGNR